MKLSRFTDAGFSEFEDFCGRLHEAWEARRPCDVPRHLLDEDGMSEEVRRFLRPGSDDVRRFYITMTLDDAEHYDEDQKKEIAAQYPDYEREARISGVPMLGSGRIYPLPEEAIRFLKGDVLQGKVPEDEYEIQRGGFVT